MMGAMLTQGGKDFERVSNQTVGGYILQLALEEMWTFLTKDSYLAQVLRRTKSTTPDFWAF